jgi:hypothetical protein
VCDFVSQSIVVDGIRLAVYMIRPIDDPDALVMVQAPVGTADRAALAGLIAAAA